MESAEYIRNLLRVTKGKRYKNISQLAERAGVPQGNLSEFMNGKRDSLTFDTVWKLFQAIGFEIGSIERSDDCHELQRQLAEERQRVSDLERQLYMAKGEIAALQRMHDKALAALACSSKPEKSCEWPDLDNRQQDAG